jgi:hypothetical protein
MGFKRRAKMPDRTGPNAQGNRLNQLVTRSSFSESTARVVSEMECSHAAITYCQQHAGFS